VAECSRSGPGSDSGALVLRQMDEGRSTVDAITTLNPKLSVGGYCLIDDYGGIPACRAAVDEYRSSNGINEPVQWGGPELHILAEGRMSQALWAWPVTAASIPRTTV
jgi:Macrocin-O-methyltransferase (TylF)